MSTNVKVAPVRWTPAERRLLAVLVDNEQLSQTEIARKMDMDDGAISRIVGKLADHRIVTVSQPEHDKRRNIVTLTAQGRKLAGSFCEKCGGYGRSTHFPLHRHCSACGGSGFAKREVKHAV